MTYNKNRHRELIFKHPLSTEEKEELVRLNDYANAHNLWKDGWNEIKDGGKD